MNFNKLQVKNEGNMRDTGGEEIVLACFHPNIAFIFCL